jgi:PAS domain S-box-containing protein
MPAVHYPFIDIAVHKRVRERFSRGEAMVLFSADLSRLLWANGAGAELFGQAAVYDLLDQGVNRADITFRQLQATARQLADIGDSRGFMIRIAKGFQRLPTQATAELIGLSSGEHAILFSVPNSAKPLAAGASAKQMLQGLDDPDTHMAVIGAEGDVIAASPGYASLGITQQTAKTLIGLAGAHPERLVKRPVATGKGYLPAAVGKLSDDPALNLLFAVETVIGHLDSIDPPAPSEGLSTAAVNHIEERQISNFTDVIDAVAGIEDVEEALEDAAGGEAETATPAAEQPVHDDILQAEEHVTAETLPSEGDEDGSLRLFADAENGVSPDAALCDDAPPETEAAEPETAAVPAEEGAHLPPVEEASLAEAPSSSEEEPATVEETVPAETESKETAFVFKPNARATRFVWKIDAEGRLSEISGEFADAVGPHAANVIGSAFSDISALFNLDPEGKIAEALARRDTWSGKTIHWPVEGTSLTVPVDLAALPTYTRSREFDGFRGFGVVRLSDAAEDPLALGLTLGPDGIGHDITDLNAPIAIAADEPIAEPAKETAEDEAPVALKPQAGRTAADELHVDQLPETEINAETANTDEPPTMEEPPALRIVETPNRRLSDKIVQLHGASPTLSAAEQANFREIAKRLEAFGAREESSTDATEEPRPEETPKADRPPEETPSPQEAIFENAAGAEEEATSAEEPAAEDKAKLPADDGVTEGLEETISQMDVLTSFIPPRVKMTDGLSAGMIDQLPVAVLIHAGDALIHANPEFRRLTGYESLEALGEVGGIDALLQRHELEERAGRPGTMMLVKVDDTLVPVTARLQSIRWEESSALMLALMPVEGAETAPAQSETNRADARSADRMVEKVAKLQVEVEELRSILETATDGVVVIGIDGDIRSMNRSASALFNYDEEETRGKPFVMLFAHESQKAVLDYLNGLSGHGVASVLNDGREVIGRESAGGFVPLFMTMGELTSSNGYCAVIRDITQWKRTEDELRNAKGAAETANAHKTDFLARVSHEIRTPLNAIIGFSDMMAGERFGPIGHPRYIEYASDIGRSGRHVLDIVNDLLDISKIEAGEMDLDFGAVGLNEAISEAVALVQPQANGQRVIIRTALSQSVPNVVADLRSIKQIALNILSNAIRFTPSGGQIVVSTSYETNGSVVLRVRDTGIGMTRSELDQAMKPFRQVSTQSRHRGDGTGLGLPLTKAMVDANRAIFAINSTPNEGTLVEVTFPSPRVLAG